jgi:citrate lyase beta subunit
MFDKAVKSGVDIVCLELEDGIAPADKSIARENALKIINKKKGYNNIEVLIRINSIREIFGLLDITAILNNKTQPDGLLVPKIKSPEELKILDNLFTEKKLNTKFHAIIETNSGLEKANEIATSTNRLEALFFGAVDMSAELRCQNSWNNLLYARSKVVHAAASKQLDVIDVPFLDLDNLKKMKEEATNSKNLGFTGKGAIHPKQIKILNNVFTPTLQEVKKAKKIISLFEKSSSGLVLYKGKLIEKPVLRDMYRVVNIYNKVNNQECE